MEDPKPQFIARNSPWIARFGIVLCLAFVALGVGLLTMFYTDPYGDFGRMPAAVAPIIAWILIVAFALLSIHWINAAQDERPQLIIDRTGIFWRPWMENTLSWEDITKIEVVEINMVTHIYLTPQDPNRAASTHSAMALVWSVDWLFGNKRIPIKPFGLDKSTGDIMRAIDTFRPLI